MLKIRQIRDCQNAAAYVQLIDHLSGLNTRMNDEENITAILPLFEQLKEIAVLAEKSSCQNLRSKMIDPLVKSWSSTISEPIIKLINDEFKQIGFPFEGDTVKPITKDLIELKNYFVMLDSLDLPPYLRPDEPPLPIQILLSQLVKKFQFFFYSSSSKLNDISKPEYYFGLVLKWLQSNQNFISKHMEGLESNIFFEFFFCRTIFDPYQRAF